MVKYAAWPWPDRASISIKVVIDTGHGGAGASAEGSVATFGATRQGSVATTGAAARGWVATIAGAPEAATKVPLVGSDGLLDVRGLFDAEDDIAARTMNGRSDKRQAT